MFKEMEMKEVMAVDGGGPCGAVIGFGLGLASGAVKDAFKQQSGQYNSKGAMTRILQSGVKGAFAGAVSPL